MLLIPLPQWLAKVKFDRKLGKLLEVLKMLYINISCHAMTLNEARNNHHDNLGEGGPLLALSYCKAYTLCIITLKQGHESQIQPNKTKEILNMHI